MHNWNAAILQEIICRYALSTFYNRDAYKRINRFYISSQGLAFPSMMVIWAHWAPKFERTWLVGITLVGKYNDNYICIIWITSVMFLPTLLVLWAETLKARGSFHWRSLRRMMTSLNGNMFRVTGHLCGEFTGRRSQRQVTRSFDVFFDLRLNKRLSKQSWGWWF